MIALIPYIAIIAFTASLILSNRVLSGTAALTYAGVVSVGLLATVDAMGLPKPMWSEIRGDEIRVASAMYDPEVAIYITTASNPPRLYRLPWETGTARKMQEAQRGGGGLVLRRGQDNAGDWIPYELPVESDPPKTE